MTAAIVIILLKYPLLIQAGACPGAEGPDCTKIDCTWKSHSSHNISQMHEWSKKTLLHPCIRPPSELSQPE